ncbi:MAG TPA: helix-turn-helix transcriptional regulator [Actinomycetales bacterium]|nr:helix-turn-helix transcriptional regulator [Actinomycetales bacterium]
MTEIGDRVRELRLQRAISQTALAGSDLSPSYISLIEAGRRAPSDEALRVIAGRLGTSVEFLRTGSHNASTARAELELSFAKVALANGEPAAALERLASVPLGGVDPDLALELQLVQADAHEKSGDLEAAAGILEELLTRTADAKAWVLYARAANGLVAAYIESGDLHRAVDVGVATRTNVEAAGLSGTDEHIRLVTTLVWAYQSRGDLLYAEMLATQLTEQVKGSGTPRAQGSVYWNSALVAEDRGDVRGALRLAERAVALMSEETDSPDLPRLHLLLGWLKVRGSEPDPEGALRELDAADRGLAAHSSVVDQAYSRVERARANLMLGRSDDALEHARAALDLLGEAPRVERCEALLMIADVLFARHQRQRAMTMYALAADQLTMMSAQRSAGRVWRDLGDRFAAIGDDARAASAYASALDSVGLPSTGGAVVQREVSPSRY